MNILVLGDTSACSYWRLLLPFSHLKNSNSTIDINMRVNESSLTDIYNADIIVISRHYDKKQLEKLTNLKKAGKKIIYDLDDDIWNIEKSNQCYQSYSVTVLNTIEHILDIADVITTTTTELKNEIAKHTTTDVSVIPNRIDFVSYRQRKNNNSKRNRLLWSGSNTHNNDMIETNLANELTEILDNRTRLTIIGDIPESLSHLSINHYKFTGITDYIRNCHNSLYSADIGLLPLAVNKFNSSKSELKLLEYVAMNMIPVSNHKRYTDILKRYGLSECIVVNNCWHSTIEQSKQHREQQRALYNESIRAIKNDYDIKHSVNEWIKLLCI